MNIEIKRTTFTNTSTIGELYINGVFECFTLEDVVREVKDTPVSKWKVQDKTAIPKGVYNVIINRSFRFKTDLPLLEKVEGFTGIRIHSGNTANNTDGCILVGRTKSKDFVGNSKPAFSSLFIKMREAIKNKQKITLKIG